MTRDANALPAAAASTADAPVRRAARYPPLNESPAAVVSTTDATGRAGTDVTVPSQYTTHPLAPSLTTTSGTPSAAIRLAQAVAAWSPYNFCSSANVGRAMSVSASVWSMARRASASSSQPWLR